MLFLSNEVNGVLDQKIIVIYHPENKDKRDFIDKYRARSVGYSSKPMYVEAGVTRLADYVWKNHSNVVVLPCNEKSQLDYVKRLTTYLPVFKQLMGSDTTKLYFCGNTVNLISDKVLIVPDKNVFYNDTTHSLNIDIESNGLGLIKNTWYDTVGYSDVNSPRGKVLKYLSNIKPIYTVSDVVEYGNSTEDNLTEFNKGNVSDISNDEYSKLFSSDKTKIKPMSPIYKEEDNDD